MSILINASAQDMHARAVTWGLRNKDVDVHHLSSDAFSQATCMSVRLGRFERGITLHVDDTPVMLDKVHAVWNRRPFERLQLGAVRPEDATFVRAEVHAAREGMYRLLQHACSVNPLDALVRAENKIYQLTVAVGLGLRIPETLFSSIPEDIRTFLRRHQDCIYKPLHGHVWEADGARRATYTARVSETDLPSDPLLRAAPGIYQARVNHSHEVRAQFFGSECAAIRIEHPSEGCIDWRRRQHTIHACEPAHVPADLQRYCRQLMAELGLVAAGFDFLVTEDDDWIFLELNQAGQFLFIEQWCPELPVLDMFCEFMRSPSAQWRYRAGPPMSRARFGDFTKTFNQCIAS